MRQKLARAAAGLEPVGTSAAAALMDVATRVWADTLKRETAPTLTPERPIVPKMTPEGRDRWARTMQRLFPEVDPSSWNEMADALDTIYRASMFSSKLEQILDRKLPNKFTLDQLVSILSKPEHGVPRDESTLRAMVVLVDALGRKKQNLITKEELRKWLAKFWPDPRLGLLWYYRGPHVGSGDVVGSRPPLVGAKGMVYLGEPRYATYQLSLPGQRRRSYFELTIGLPWPMRRTIAEPRVISGHFSEVEPLAVGHIRGQEVYSPELGRGLLIDEIQSDVFQSRYTSHGKTLLMSVRAKRAALARLVSRYALGAGEKTRELILSRQAKEERHQLEDGLVRMIYQTDLPQHVSYAVEQWARTGLFKEQALGPEYWEHEVAPSWARRLDKFADWDRAHAPYSSPMQPDSTVSAYWFARDLINSGVTIEDLDKLGPYFLPRLLERTKAIMATEGRLAVALTVPAPARWKTGHPIPLEYESMWFFHDADQAYKVWDDISAMASSESKLMTEAGLPPLPLETLRYNFGFWAALSKESILRELRQDEESATSPIKTDSVIERGIAGLVSTTMLALLPGRITADVNTKLADYQSLGQLNLRNIDKLRNGLPAELDTIRRLSDILLPEGDVLPDGNGIQLGKVYRTVVDPLLPEHARAKLRPIPYEDAIVGELTPAQVTEQVRAIGENLVTLAEKQEELGLKYPINEELYSGIGRSLVTSAEALRELPRLIDIYHSSRRLTPIERQALIWNIEAAWRILFHMPDTAGYALNPFYSAHRSLPALFTLLLLDSYPETTTAQAKKMLESVSQMYRKLLLPEELDRSYRAKILADIRTTLRNKQGGRGFSEERYENVEEYGVAGRVRKTVGTPWERDWEAQFLKIALALAARSGARYLAWTRAEHQAERYGRLMRRIKEVHWSLSPEGDKVSVFVTTGTEQRAIDSDLHALEGTVGAGLARHIREAVSAGQTQGSVSGEAAANIAIGSISEGMRKEYDEKLPSAAQKLAKQYGLQFKPSVRVRMTIKREEPVAEPGATRSVWVDEEVPAVIITPEGRKKILEEGVPIAELRLRQQPPRPIVGREDEGAAAPPLPVLSTETALA